MGTRKRTNFLQRKRKPDVHRKEEESHSSPPTRTALPPGWRTSPGRLQPNQVLALQRAAGNRAVTRLLGRDNAAPMLVQRRGNNIPQAAALLSQAKAGFKLKGKSTYGKLMDAVRAYHQLPADDYQGQLDQLSVISGLIATWERKHGPAVQVAAGPGGKLSKGNKRRNVVYSLKQALAQEQTFVHDQYVQSLPPITADTFTGANEQNVIPNAVGGQMSKLDEITYGFGVATSGARAGRVAGGQFTGYFKKQDAVDPLGGAHRGKATGIPVNDPKFNERSLATYKINQLLGENIIPPTFAATHAGQAGIVMEKIQGIVGRQATAEQLANPLVRQALSKIYLLDAICGQVDRHPGNFMVVIENGVIKGAQGIDNDLAFGQQYDAAAFEAFQMMGRNMPGAIGMYVAGKVPSILDEIDQPFAQKIIELATRPNDVRAALAGLLAPGEIDATIARLTKLADFLRPLIGVENGVMKTQWE